MAVRHLTCSQFKFKHLFRILTMSLIRGFNYNESFNSQSVFRVFPFWGGIPTGYASSENTFHTSAEKPVYAFSEELPSWAKKHEKFGSIGYEPRYNTKIKIKNP